MSRCGKKTAIRELDPSCVLLIMLMFRVHRLEVHTIGTYAKPTDTITERRGYFFNYTATASRRPVRRISARGSCSRDSRSATVIAGFDPSLSRLPCHSWEARNNDSNTELLLQIVFVARIERIVHLELCRGHHQVPQTSTPPHQSGA